LSRDCNRPALAAAAGREALGDVGCRAMLTTAEQYTASRPIALDGDLKRVPA
jgi:hypothetical protein